MLWRRRRVRQWEGRGAEDYIEGPGSHEASLSPRNSVQVAAQETHDAQWKREASQTTWGGQRGVLTFGVTVDLI